MDPPPKRGTVSTILSFQILFLLYRSFIISRKYPTFIFMKTTTLEIHVSDTLEKVDGEIIAPAAPQALLVLAHGAGAGMHHLFMVELARALAHVNIASLRFQFPYMQQGKRRPDTPAVAGQTIAAAISEASKRYPALPVYAGGKSFGGRMTSVLAASRHIERLKGLVFYGFPLHPPGNPSVKRATHLKDIPYPMLFLQGTRDKLAQPDLIRQVTENLPKTELIAHDGADHSFHMLKKSGVTDEQMIQKLAFLTYKWMKI